MTLVKCYLLNLYLVTIVFTILKSNVGYGIRKYSREDLIMLREEVRQMFEHAYTGYLKYAYPYDELRPLSCDGIDTWGSYSLTLIDALDTLAVMGNYTEFQRVVDIVISKANFDANINVSVFETNIRIVGGLLSAHLLSQRAGVKLEPGWPCNGPLLRLAEDVAKRLIAAFDTATGMPYGTVNLRYGVPPGETSVTCTAGVGTFIVEFGALSRLTGDPVYEEVALNALHVLYNHRSSIGLYGNHIDVLTGRWTAQDSGIGAGVDSYFEYLAKGAVLLQRPELIAMFNEGRTGIDKYLKRNDWYLWVSMQKGQVTLPVFQSLEAYWPGVLSLIGDVNAGMKSMHNYHQVWKQYGFTPEFYNIPQGQVGANRESYPLRPELVESAMYLYRATGDPFLLDIGVDILRSIQHSAYTPCGFATIKDTRDHGQENRMESFFLAETTKYLYLLFDPDNFIHNKGQHGTIHTLPTGKECILDAGGYIFNTEAHPLDPGALHCCSEYNEERKLFRNADTMQAKGEKYKPRPEMTAMRDNQKESDISDNAAEKADEHKKDNSNEQNIIDTLDTLKESWTVDISKILQESDTDYNSLYQSLLETKVPASNDKDNNFELIMKVLSTFSSKLMEKLELSAEIQNKMINDIDNTLNDLSVFRNTFVISEEMLQMLSSLPDKYVNEFYYNERIELSNMLVELIDSLAESKSIILEFNQLNNTAKIIKLRELLEYSFDRKMKTQVFVKKLKSYYKKLDEKMSSAIKRTEDSTEKVETAQEEIDKFGEKLEKKFSHNWKSEDIAYQVDDRERVMPVTKLDTNPLFTDKIDTKDSDNAISSDFVSKYKLLPGSGGGYGFDPQQLLERIRTGPGYERNSTWLTQYELLSCIPQPFLTRIMLSGEFYYAE